jgi:hypothetical protein
MLRCSRHFLSTLVFATALGSVHAAELGEARVTSYIGQPLVADIELAMVDDPSQAVSVRVASPEVYNGAGIAMPPVLAGLNLSVMRRDGRQFLHVTSLRPVNSEHLHLYLELVDKGQRTVRLATLWLTPDPNPAPVPVAVPVPVPVPAVVAAPVAPTPASKPATVRKAEPVPMHAEEEGAKQQAPVKARPHARKPVEAAHAEPKAAALPLPIHAPQAAPAACVQQAEQAKVCAALDGKNAELQAKLGTLEGKVKSLQATLGAAPPAAAAASAHAATPAPASAPVVAKEPPGPKPISAMKPLVPRKPKAPPPEPESGLPWGWIGGAAALLLALGGAAMLLRRRVRTVRKVDMPAEPRLIDRLRHSFAPRAGAAPAASEPAQEAVEPSFE